MTKTFNEAS